MADLHLMIYVLAILIGCTALGILCCCVSPYTCTGCTTTPHTTYKVVIGGTVAASSCSSGTCQSIKGTYFLDNITPTGDCCWQFLPSWGGCLASYQLILLMSTSGTATVALSAISSGTCVFGNNSVSSYWTLTGDRDCNAWSNTSFAPDWTVGACDTGSATCLVTAQ